MDKEMGLESMIKDLIRKLRAYPSAVCMDSDIQKAADLIEDMDEITIQSLKLAYRLNCVEDKIDCSDYFLGLDEELLDSLDRIIQYFSTEEQYQKWVLEKQLLTF
jgi:hypothetical protein